MGHCYGKVRTCLLCDRQAIGRGLCRSHYQMHWKAGTLGDFPVVQPHESFVNRIEKTEGCWLWKGSTNAYGYGIFLLPGEVKIRAHRYAYELFRGPIPTGKVVMHLCDNPPCVNPDHLRLGTKLDNNRDCSAKGRRPAGVRHWNARLTDVQVSAIKADQRSITAVAKEYGIANSTVSRIKSGTRRNVAK